MHLPGRTLLALLALAASACVKLDSFACAQSSECQNGDVAGMCEPGGMCSFPDTACASGKKFGELAGAYSGQCVDASGTTGDTPTTTPTTVGPTTFEPTATTHEPGDTTLELSSTSSSTTLELTTSETTGPTLTGEPDTTTGATCGELGEACVNGTCCGPCMGCQDEVCMALPPDQGPQHCGGECTACGDDGQCQTAAPGVACNSNCGEIIFKEEKDDNKTSCYGYGPMPTTGWCDDGGTCRPPDPLEAKCLAEPVLLAQCDTTCVKNADLCVPGHSASAVETATYCVLSDSSALCKTTCSDDQLSSHPAACDGAGSCVDDVLQSCNGYFCDANTVMCATSCENDDQCVAPKICKDSQCT